MAYPRIPRSVKVHLGKPDEPARDVIVPFQYYIKNVASSEIYPTWPTNAIKANIYAQISFALNRIYTEWYRSRGYDFDITSSPMYDQAFIDNRDIFENVSQIVDGIFTDYLRKQGSIVPFPASYCNGTTTKCPGLSQWGSVELAKKGQTPLQILQNYYGKDVELVYDAPTSANLPSYPGRLLRLGSAGNDVKIIQSQLNAISRNYPAIPKIPRPDGAFGVDTEAAVRKFQEVFELPVDGIVGKATWYKIKYIYNSVKQLAELSSEGIKYSELAPIYPTVLKKGMKGKEVSAIQYYLNVISRFNDSISFVEMDGNFGPASEQQVKSFQREYGLTPDGIVGRDTWAKIEEIYRKAILALPPEFMGEESAVYPGIMLKKGQKGKEVRTLQTFIAGIADSVPDIPKIPITGEFGDLTENAVRIIQKKYDLPVNGLVGPITWNKIADLYFTQKFKDNNEGKPATSS